MVTRVLVVEDDAFVRLTLEATLAGGGLDVVAVGRSDEALRAVRAATAPFDVALLDLHLGDGPTGLDLAHVLRRAQPELGVVMLTSLADPRLVGEGAPGLPPGTRYVEKASVGSVELLLDVVRGAADPSSGPSGTVTTSRARTGPGRDVTALTDTQIETLRLVADGLTNAEIAARRSVSERSVEMTVRRIASILGLARDATRNQRVHMARVYFRSLGGPSDAR